MTPPKIAIIGAGPAGLTFARLLQINNLPCTIYEADADRSMRNQGGTLDLHPEAGQRALKEAGLFDEFLKYARPEGQADKIVKFDGEVLWDENELGSIRPPEMDDRPEIDRQDLRNLLLDSVEPQRIKWDHKVASIEVDPRDRSKMLVHFANGTTEREIDLVVGADGAWSKVRPLLTDERPFYSGITGVELWSQPNISHSNPWMSQYVGAGSMYMFDEGRAVISQRQGNGGTRTYACLRVPEDWKDNCGIDWESPAAVREAMVTRYFADCAEDIKRLIMESDDKCVIRQMWMLPVDHKWRSVPGVTLLGDSAHLMTPFAGVGVNLALADALQLASKLVEKKDGVVAKAFSHAHNIQTAVQSYEAEMFERSQKYAQKTFEGLKGHFSKDGGVQRAEKYKRDYQELKQTGVLN